MKKLHAEVSGGCWSYVVNENGNAVRTSLEGYGSCTPVDAMQKMIDGLSEKQFNELWDKCENKKDVKD
jgi:hypothetical protein